MKKFVLTLAILLFTLCVAVNTGFAQKRSIDLGKIITEMKLNKKGKFPYGFKPGTLRAKVKPVMKEHADMIASDSTSVTYSFFLGDDDIDYCDITFDFPQRDKLSSASIATFLGSAAVSEKSFDSIKANFNKLYGPATAEENTYYWKLEKKGKTLEIQMWEVAKENDFGYGIDFLYY